MGVFDSVQRIQIYGRKPGPHRLLADHLTAEYWVRTEGRGRTVDEWKVRPEQFDNHWLDCPPKEPARGRSPEPAGRFGRAFHPVQDADLSVAVTGALALARARRACDGLEGRKPRLLLRLPGLFLSRLDERQFLASLFQLPPRLTRLVEPMRTRALVPQISVTGTPFLRSPFVAARSRWANRHWTRVANSSVVICPCRSQC